MDLADADLAQHRRLGAHTAAGVEAEGHPAVAHRSRCHDAGHDLQVAVLHRLGSGLDERVGVDVADVDPASKAERPEGHPGLRTDDVDGLDDLGLRDRPEGVERSEAACEEAGHRPPDVIDPEAEHQLGQWP